MRFFPACGNGAFLLFLSAAAATSAQAPPTQKPVPTITPDIVSQEALLSKGRELVEKAKAGNGSQSITLAQYKGHYTMLSARTKSGGAEVHKRFADFLIVLEGEGTELTGGTVVDAKESANGEIRGSHLEGATPHLLHKGDVLHIPAGVPHQAVQANGQTIVNYVIKVEEPATEPIIK